MQVGEQNIGKLYPFCDSWSETFILTKPVIKEAEGEEDLKIHSPWHWLSFKGIRQVPAS